MRYELGMTMVKKFFYVLPAAVISLIYLFLLWVTRADTNEILNTFSGVAGLYLLLPIAGSILLLNGKWWGSFVGMAMGLLLIYQNQTYRGFQHVNIELPLGIACVAYYAFLAFLCKKEK